VAHWIDTHCHLDAPEFGDAALAQRALAAARGVQLCVLPAVSVPQFNAVRSLAHATGDGYALGIHPLYVASQSEGALSHLAQALQQNLADPHLVAVGEIGLDYFVPELRAPRQRERQWHFYTEQLRLARQFDLPVLLHVRGAVDAITQGLRALAGPGGRWHGIAHAFNGSTQQARQLIDLGLHLGFGGAVTFDRALNLRTLVRTLPPQAIVLETDAPDMPPQWLYRSAAERAAGAVQGVNSPAELPRIGAEMAVLQGVSVKELSDVTTRNAIDALPRLSAFRDRDRISP